MKCYTCSTKKLLWIGKFIITIVSLTIVVTCLTFFIKNWRDEPMLFKFYMISVIITFIITVLMTIRLINIQNDSNLRHKFFIRTFQITSLNFLITIALLVIGISMLQKFENIQNFAKLMTLFWNIELIGQIIVLFVIICKCWQKKSNTSNFNSIRRSQNTNLYTLEIRNREDQEQLSTPTPTRNYIEILTTQRILTDEMLSKLSIEDNLCVICLATYLSTNCIVDLPCSHFFHKECIEEWLRYNRLCPSCRGSVLTHQS